MRTLSILWLAAAPLLLSTPSGLDAQASDENEAVPDSAALLEELRESQEAFEGYRESRIPVTTGPSGARCDARMGRICVWFGGASEADFPPEPPETGMARSELIGELADAFEALPHPWVLGQLVHYLAEADRLTQAEAVARRCGLPADEAWWCLALEGYALHLQERFVDAEERFREALAEAPRAEAAHWRLPPYLLTGDGQDELGDLEPAEREARLELFWRMSDPLFLVEGNDRLTDHFARMVESRNGEDAANPQGLSWEEDMEEALVRYGRNIGYSRS